MRDIYKKYVNWKDVPMPQIVANLPKDVRGYPIPANVAMVNGKPVFKANNGIREQEMAKNMQCSVTAVTMDRSSVRLITSPLNALSRPAVAADAPVHKDALDYSMKVCPYMCLGQYYKGFDMNLADKLNKKHSDESMLFKSNSPVSAIPPFMMAIHPKHLQMVKHSPADVIYTVYPADVLELDLYYHGELIPFKTARPMLVDYLQVPEIQDRLKNINRRPEDFLARFDLYAKEFDNHEKDRS